MCCTNKFFLLEFSCMGLGARLVVESQGGGRLLSRSPRVKYLGYTSNGYLFLSTFCAGGGGGSVTFGVLAVPPPPFIDSVIEWLSVALTGSDTRCHDISWILSGRRGWRRLVSASIWGVVGERCLAWEDVLRYSLTKAHVIEIILTCKSVLHNGKYIGCW